MSSDNAKPKTETVLEHDENLSRAVKTVFGLSWEKARRAIDTGKIYLDGKPALDRNLVGRKGQTLSYLAAARNVSRPRTDDWIRFMDTQVVVVAKPSGISTVPYDGTESGTLDEYVRKSIVERSKGARNIRPTVGVVHRIDKDTSGLVVFTRTWLAKQALSSQFRSHTVRRSYLAVVHGRPRETTYHSHLVEDRGDGLRGSVEWIRRRFGNGPPLTAGKPATTHIEVLQSLAGLSLIRCRLETGKTHQIRIHLSEAGHPLVGETVYKRDFRGELWPASRLLLHAAELGFVHPSTEAEVFFEEKWPDDFQREWARIEKAEQAAPKK